MTSRMSAPSKLRTTASSVSTPAFGAEASCALQSTICISKTITRLVPPIPPTLTHPLLIITPRSPHHPHCRPRPLPAHVRLSDERDADVVASAGYLGESLFHLARRVGLPRASFLPGPGLLVRVL